ncbi:hypothetical protein ACFV4M_01980 [Kitasatospora indigofera]|uniref:hypothetical protein n=1 Tax=Kitasatospora indigofera TaxID=67307 RepID=UPI003667AE1D
MISSLLDRITGRTAQTARDDEAYERACAELLDGNLARLRRADPDLDQIFSTTFLDAHRDDRARDRLTEEIKAYAVAKHAAGRMDLYNALFAGLGD